ncbi:formiminoglutamase [Dethiosulfatibacter aminovorans DSM 17477]|uniref:Formiminoglutamase n=1 Tax=Dethiosulfatibacter aminovorans DSM 17477 TaxID=1121476 RepID=A0A1M6HUM1_9FIRM|nr:agmatinase family protein [Dethiosulfatibacter aminovorans]SHJ25857.1 formiminoglutamase [Dethiosulfatibacter aminovorans DSM 17477]
MKHKFGLYGITYDTSAGRGWPGSRYAPDSIRKAMAGVQSRMEGNKLFDVVNNKIIDYNQIDFKDFGNTDQISRYDHEKTIQEIKEEINKIFREGYTPILLGGDHSVTWPGILSLYENTSGKIGIIDLDAHLDIKDDSPVQGKYSGSSQIRRAIELERIDGKNVVEIGPRGYNYPEHFDFIRDSQMTIIPPDEVFEKGADKVAERALALASEGVDHIYLTVDIDVLDTAFAWGSGGQEPAGITSYQLSRFVKKVAPYVDIIDIVEVNPMTDHRELTSTVAANLVLDFIAAVYNAGCE